MPFEKIYLRKVSAIVAEQIIETIKDGNFFVESKLATKKIREHWERMKEAVSAH